MAVVSFIDQILSKPRLSLPGVVDIEQQEAVRYIAARLEESRSPAAFDGMASFIAHDCRHHLSAVYANAELMCNSKFAQSDREEMLVEIKTAVLCMTDILDSLILQSKSGSMFQLRREPLNLIIEKAVQMVRSHPDADKVELMHEGMPFVEVSADPTWLCSAIFNLLLNACQAVQLVSSSKEVRVAYYQDRNYVLIRITDSGPGISKTLQKTLFLPFVSSTQRRGTGLGLTIVKSIVREHGGKVYLEESKPGNTSVVVRLPRPYTIRTKSFASEMDRSKNTKET